jgi:hypothetical protein
MPKKMDQLIRFSNSAGDYSGALLPLGETMHYGCRALG